MAWETTKQRLLDECQKLDVSIHLDDSADVSSGAYSNFRGVASEAELERRLLAKKAVTRAGRANWIAICALIISLGSLAISLWKT